MINNFHHVQITVDPSEESAARDFYVGVLGLRPVDKPESLMTRGGFWVEVGHQQLHVGLEEGIVRQRTKAHVAYQVENLAETRRLLAEAGIEPLASIPIPGHDRFECRDPFGNRLEFIQPLEGDEQPTRRFTSRVDNYVRYRPGYPAAALDWLAEVGGLANGSVVADIGSGTGILTGLLLSRGATVYAVEPNDAMRGAAERALTGRAGFVSVATRAEGTGLPDASVDLITAGQAFHWFDAAAARVEFMRILRPGCGVALIWNSRDTRDTGFVTAYEALLHEYAGRYARLRHGSRMDRVTTLFADGFQMRVFDHQRSLDYDAVLGGLLSGSYSPLPGDPRYEPMVTQLRHIFATHQRDGQVTMPYRTQVYFGRLSP